ncbi:glycosyltransferase family 4 protein [Alicyclobacillus vulcanalis]|uniref:Glycosyltransferase involved in cell wall bisynthesis n=1 Tax=Alicyclobacillus vulcanalis TaxID=252246 RepID=A0A1N7N5G0_9BACL|nr:glycosyltransferase family 4 protein [Alicyclobacillus vulcanalis]SIS93596.1 Glycosyltransferase involved in cell wall bisynthesis [Alicyclobacillus vulcanalis]
MTLEIGYVSTYVPRKCGLATYTHHLRQSVRQAAGSAAADQVIAMLAPDEDMKDYNRSYWFLRREERRDYARIARRVNDSRIGVVSLQHEFGIFGGEAGAYILDFIHTLDKPLVTTFHTVFQKPMSPYREVQKEIAQRSDAIVVMNRQAIDYLVDAFAISPSKIHYLPHGTPTRSLTPRDELRRRFGWQNRAVIVTFGLLGPSKGIEFMLDAMPAIVRKVPNALYVIAGQTHPEIVKREGEAYRESLMRRVKELRLDDHVVMLNQYMSESDIVDLITAADLYVTPYPNMEQITSGTLAYAVGIGQVVLTTPYAYARDLLKDVPELLVPFGDTRAWAERAIEILSDEGHRARYAERISAIGNEMTWPRVGERYWQLIQAVARQADQVASGVKGFAVIAH